MKFEIHFGVKNLDNDNSKKVYTIDDLYKEQMADNAKAVASKDFSMMLIQYRQTLRLRFRHEKELARYQLRLRFRHEKELARYQLDNLAVESFRLEAAMTALCEQSANESNKLSQKIIDINNQ